MFSYLLQKFAVIQTLKDRRWFCTGPQVVFYSKSNDLFINYYKKNVLPEIGVFIETMQKFESLRLDLEN